MRASTPHKIKPKRQSGTPEQPIGDMRTAIRDMLRRGQDSGPVGIVQDNGLVRFGPPMEELPDA